MALYQFSQDYGNDGYRSASDTARENMLAQRFGANAGYSGWADKALGEEIGQQAGTLWKQVDPAMYRDGVNWDANLQNTVSNSLVQVDGKWFMPQQLEAQIQATSPYAGSRSEGTFLNKLGGMLPLILGGGAALAGASGALGGGSIFGGAGAAGAGTAAGGLPESYWSMLAENGASGLPSAASGTVGGSSGLAEGLSAADLANLNEIYATNGAGYAGGASPSWLQQAQNFLTPSPSSLATNAATKLAGGGMDGNPGGLDGALGDNRTNYAAGLGATNPATAGGGSIWGNLLTSLASPSGITSLGGILSGLLGAGAQSNAANNASGLQSQFAQAGMDEQRRRFDAVQSLLQPYVSAGTGALTGQQNLLGLNGAEAQQGSYNNILNSPAFASMSQSGENALLQNSAATGGLRGGNTQAALAQFRPQLLAQLIQQQFSNFGGLASMGQNAAAGVGNAGMASGNNVSNLLQQQGAAQAGNALAQGRTQNNAFGAIGSGLGLFAGAGGFNNIF